jgi:hypothetical protein
VGPRACLDTEVRGKKSLASAGDRTHPLPCTMGTGFLFPGGKWRPGRDADHSPPNSAKVVNV